MPFHCKDVDDFLKTIENPESAFRDKLASAELVKNDSEEVDLDPAGCQFDSFEVLGEMATGAVAIFSRVNRKIYFTSLKDLTLDRLVQIGGNEVLDRVSRKIQPGMMVFERLKRHLIVEASQHQLPDAQFFGQGIHSIQDGRLLVVDGGFAYLWDGDKFTPQTTPRIEDWFVNLQAGREWIDFEELTRAVREMTPSRAEQIKNHLVSLFSQWRFKGALDHLLIAGFFLAQIVQAQWEWRPHLWLTGSADSGKSILIRFMKALAGKLALSLEGGMVSEPGLRQSIKSDSSLVTIDEFEECSARDLIIKFLRSAGRGGTGARGTQSQEAIKTEIRHMVAVASIEIGIDRAAETTRFLCVSTVKTDGIKEPQTTDNNDLPALRLSLFAIALWASKRAKLLLQNLDYIKGYDHRFLESLAEPFSMLAVCSTAGPANEMNSLIRDYVAEWEEQNGEFEEDETKLLEDIQMAKIKVHIDIEDAAGFVSSRYVERTVSQVIQNLTPEGDETLQANGIRVSLDEGLMLYPTKVSMLLKGTIWEGLNIKHILLRLPGAQFVRRQLAGKQTRLVVIPMDDDSKGPDDAAL